MSSLKFLTFIMLLFFSTHKFLAPAYPLQLNRANEVAKIYLPQPEITANVPFFQKGLSYSAWSSDAFNTPESDISLNLLTETNSEWIALCFSWFQSNTTSHDIQLDSINSPTTESVQHAITVAHSLGLKVMLKPMVEARERENIQSYPVWRGEIKPSNEWFESYSNFINFFAEFAERNKVEMFCVGCEYKETTGKIEQWDNVIKEVRKRYSGPITYAADWTNYENILWWDLVDFVGIDAYFPLTLFESNPSFEELKNVWSNHADEIEEWLTSINKPVIFTEIGYRSGDGTSMAPSNYWTEMKVDLQEQNDCYEAAFQTLWKRKWFFGFYWWTWIYDPAKGGSDDSSHTPQNKPVEDIITKWYSLERKVVVIDQTYTSVEICKINEVQSISFHARWDIDGSNVVNGHVYVNGTEYVTNETGWITFSTSYDTGGKRFWVVTDVQHPEASYYTVTVNNPHIIWDEVIVDIEVASTGFGVITLILNLNYAHVGESIKGVALFVNGKKCNEIEPGVYETRIDSWSPYQQVNVHTNNEELLGENWLTTNLINPMNVIVFLAIFTVTIVILALFLKRIIRKNPNQLRNTN